MCVVALNSILTLASLQINVLHMKWNAKEKENKFNSSHKCVCVSSSHGKTMNHWYIKWTHSMLKSKTINTQAEGAKKTTHTRTHAREHRKREINRQKAKSLFDCSCTFDLLYTHSTAQHSTALLCSTRTVWICHCCYCTQCVYKLSCSL